jgi:uncharacterized protein (TIGR03435 family)
MKSWLRARKSIFWRTLLFGTSGWVAVVAPIALSQAPPPASAPANIPVFEVASIKSDKSGPGGGVHFRENGVSVINMPLMDLISTAYGIREDLISGAPAWVGTNRYDIDAKFDDTQAEELNKLPREQRNDQLKSALQSLLADRCKLKVSHLRTELPIYSLVIAKGGPKLKQATLENTYAGFKSPGGLSVKGTIFLTRPGRIIAQTAPVAGLADALSRLLNRTIVDNTGLTGKYDITLTWAPDETELETFNNRLGPGPGPVAPPPDTSGPSLFTALEEQLGLKLESTRGPVETLVIDHIEQPSGN